MYSIALDWHLYLYAGNTIHISIWSLVSLQILWKASPSFSLSRGLTSFPSNWSHVSGCTGPLKESTLKAQHLHRFFQALWLSRAPLKLGGAILRGTWGHKDVCCPKPTGAAQLTGVLGDGNHAHTALRRGVLLFRPHLYLMSLWNQP